MARAAPSARLEDLMREAKVLFNLKPSIPHAWSILEQEIHRLRHSAAAAAAASSSSTASSIPVSTQRKRVKLRVPAEQYPDYNFVGRLLGPRGATLKRLERDTACRIMIRGKGSIRKDKEPDVRGKPGWEHVFHEPLHVVIEVVDPPDDAAASRILARAKRLVEALLIPVPEERDSLKRAQLRDLAILNGTHRSVADFLAAPPPPPPPPHPHHHHHPHHHSVLHHPSSPAPPRASPASSPPPLRRAMSATSAKHLPFAHHHQDPFVHPFDQHHPVSFARAFGHNPTRPNASPVTQPSSSPPPPPQIPSGASAPSTPAPPALSNPAQPQSSSAAHTSTSVTAVSADSTTSQSAAAVAAENSNNINSNSSNNTNTTASFVPASPPSDRAFNPPDLDKLRIPSLDFDHLSEPNLALPTFAMPAASPTIVDPDIYPYPPTPGMLNLDHHLQLNTFASPVWTPSRPVSSSAQQSQPLASPSSAALPPRSPPPMDSHNSSDASNAFLLGRALGDPARAQGAFRRSKSARQHGELSFEQAFAAHSISDRDNDPPDFASSSYGYASQREQNSGSGGNQGESVLASFFPSSPLAPHIPHSHDLHDNSTELRHQPAVSFVSQEHHLDEQQHQQPLQTHQQHREHDQYRQQDAHLNPDQDPPHLPHDPHLGHTPLEQLHHDHPNPELDHFATGPDHFTGK